MDSTRPSNPVSYLTLQQAAQSLAVSIDVLMSWNENNILKPTITPTGEVGYTKQQIDQFLEIRNSSKLTVRENSAGNITNFSQENTNSLKNINPQNPINPISINNQPTNNFSQINNFNIYTPPLISSEKNISAFPAIGIFSSFSLLIIAIFLVFLSQEKKLDSILSESPTLTAESQISKVSTVDGKNKITKNTLNNEGGLNKASVLDKAFEEKKGTVSGMVTKTYKDKVAMVEGVLGREKKNIPESEVNSDLSTYSQKTNLNDASEENKITKNKDIENEVFDTEGNIKVSKDEEDENRLIATRLAMGGINQSQIGIKQNTTSMTLVSFLILGASVFYVLYSRKRQLFPSLERSQNLDKQPQNLQLVSQSPKILEVFQKTDGTVALIFQGKEIRISKPELDSESDKFIDRLMQLVGPNVKEIEYDSLQDDSLLIATPLSKLVTRLGFVGIKRELFFPRTSKTRVHFRKYLTEDDLISMNLTPDDVINGFLLSN